MPSNSQSSESVNVFSLSANNVDVQATVTWAHNSTVPLSISPSSFQIQSLSNRSFILSIVATSQATGPYSGTVYINANSANSSALIEIPLTVVVLGVNQSQNATLCTPVQLSVATYNNSALTSSSEIFTRAEAVFFSGGNVTSSSSVSINVFRNSLGPSSSISGYPKSVPTNSSGQFSDSFSSGGLASGTYNVTVTDANYGNSSYLFELSGCS
ncbi:hypothetical protein FJZ26_06260 [Candidatus Parvarchaeota archaeon]|nr:hypothetical protein [Candidatus Parvarchaeota archaeon]